MTPRAPKRWSLLLVALVSGCASRIDYSPNVRLLDEMELRRAREMLGATVGRATDPSVVACSVDPDSFRYVYHEVIHGPFGIPVGHEERQRQVYFVNVGRMELYDNGTAFLYATDAERLLSRLEFDDVVDARSYLDLVASFRARRLYREGPYTRPRGRGAREEAPPESAPPPE